ncbi:HET domain-containing protein [Colletotrichum tofieldiae]|nr:HET domain-containing protein [Colletotrichum tofieldiae]GKT81800.1 HET domain-containing protein [Colletotrichum tofieldiae]
MRLIHTKTLELQEFIAGSPNYAILSHTWGAEEVTYQDMQVDRTLIQHKTGWKKIEGCCALALKSGFNWVWIDTCCIDKTSSAELSEAINSMFQWYRQANVCFVYMVDVPRLTCAPLLTFHNNENLHADQAAWVKNDKTVFMGSRWFTRGWTLQELLAPPVVEFYTADWSYIGTREDLADILEEQTKISKDALKFSALAGFSVRTKMRWAADRQTTRVEDIAYCLLGIFDINMPLLYGEGGRAFRRLQEEILKTTEDYSILIWSSIGLRSRAEPGHAPALASQPRDFEVLRLDATHVPDHLPVEKPGRSARQITIIASRKPKTLLVTESQTGIGEPFCRAIGEFLPRTQQQEGLVFPPPSMSARGISITTFTNWKEQAGEPCDWLAWTLHEIKIGGTNYGICLDLQTEKQPLNPGINASRKWPGWLCLVPMQEVQDFKPMTFYLLAVPLLVNQQWRTTSLKTPVLGYQKAGLKFSKTNKAAAVIVQTYPPLKMEMIGDTYNFWHGLERTDVVAYGRRQVWAFVIECSKHGGNPPPYEFVVLFGRQLQGHGSWEWFCDALPVPAGGRSQAALRSFLDQKSSHEDMRCDSSALCSFDWGAVGAVVRSNRTETQWVVDVMIHCQGSQGPTG